MNCIRGRSLLYYLFIRSVTKQMVQIIGMVHDTYHLCIKSYLAFFSHIFCTCQILTQKWEQNETTHQLFTEIKTVCNSVEGFVWFFLEFCICIYIKLFILIKMHLNDCRQAHLSLLFSCSKQYETKRFWIIIASQLCYRICHEKGPRKPRGSEIKLVTLMLSYCMKTQVIYYSLLEN